MQRGGNISLRSLRSVAKIVFFRAPDWGIAPIRSDQMAAAWAAAAVLLLALARVSAAAPVTAPAFLWAPNNYGGFKDLDNTKSEGELLSELVTLLKKSGAKYTILYASQPYGLLENPSNLPLGRYLAEKTNTTKAGLGKCDGECMVKSTLLEGSFVGIVLLIILISGLKCMMGIDTPSKFEAPQES